jgi:hypothetical protein
MLPSLKWLKDTGRRDSKAVMQWIANPSSPVRLRVTPPSSRSRDLLALANIRCPGGGIGRHRGLKIPRQQCCAGSIPAPGTTLYSSYIKILFIFIRLSVPVYR